MRTVARCWGLLLGLAAVAAFAAVLLLTGGQAGADAKPSSNCGGDKPASNPPGRCTVTKLNNTHINSWDLWDVGLFGAVKEEDDALRTYCGGTHHTAIGRDCRPNHTPPSASGTKFYQFGGHIRNHGGHDYEWETICEGGSHRFGNGCHSHPFEPVPCGNGTWAPHPGHTLQQQTPCEDDDDGDDDDGDDGDDDGDDGDEDDEPVDDEPACVPGAGEHRHAFSNTCHADHEPACVPGPGEHRHAFSNTCHADHVSTPPPPPGTPVPSLSGVEVCRAGGTVQVSWSVSVPSGAAEPSGVVVEWVGLVPPDAGGALSLDGSASEAVLEVADGSTWRVYVSLQVGGSDGDSEFVDVDGSTGVCEPVCVLAEGERAALGSRVVWKPALSLVSPPRDPYLADGTAYPVPWGADRRAVAGAGLLVAPLAVDRSYQQSGAGGCRWQLTSVAISWDGGAAEELLDNGFAARVPRTADERRRGAVQLGWVMESVWIAESDSAAEVVTESGGGLYYGSAAWSLSFGG